MKTDMYINISCLGLFHRIIGQSGTDMNFWTLNYPDSDPADYTRQVAEKVECPSDDTEEMIKCMRDIEDPWQIYNNSGITCTVRALTELLITIHGGMLH